MMYINIKKLYSWRIRPYKIPSFFFPLLFPFFSLFSSLFFFPPFSFVPPSWCASVPQFWRSGLLQWPTPVVSPSGLLQWSTPVVSPSGLPQWCPSVVSLSWNTGAISTQYASILSCTSHRYRRTRAETHTSPWRILSGR